MSQAEQQYLGRLQTISLRAQVHQSLLAAILRCELPPGAVLKDRDLASALGVSRTPVREALQLLESAGLVVSTARAGYRVSAVDAKDLGDLFELRRVLEPLGIDHLEEEPDDPAIEEISGFFDDFGDDVAAESVNDYHARDHEFHLKLVACSGNRRAMEFYDIIGHHIHRGRHYLLGAAHDGVDSVDLSKTHKDHLAICKAIGDRDFDAARGLLEDHLLYGQSLMLERLANSNTGG